MKKSKLNAKWITRTAVLVALLIALQWATAGTQVFAGQYITGSLVNCVMAVASLFGGLSCGLMVAVLSPFVAFLLGIGPKLFPLIPCIALGNVVFVTLLSLVSKGKPWKKILGLTVSAFAKFLILYLLVVQVFIPAFADNLKGPQINTFTVMFSWPQLVTALIGGTLAFSILPVLHKVIKKPER